MRNVMNDILSQSKGIWSRLDAGQRFVVTAVTVATIVGLGAIVWFAGQPSYETVFTSKSGEEIGRAKTALQSAGVTFEPGDDGRTLRVERRKIGLANQAIIEAGLTGGETAAVGGGFSLIEDAETKAYKLDAATRGSVVAAILQLEGVLQVTVTASRPRARAAFRDRDADQKPTATVILKLRNGVSFEAIARAASSLASSQLTLPPQNIEVVSAAGNQRFRHDPEREGGGGTSEFLTLQRSLSDERTRMAQERLDQLWPGKTSVSVSVVLDTLWEIRSEKVVPTEALVSSETSRKDATSTPGKAADASSSTSKNETKDRKFVTEIGERRTGKSMPDVKRMTVALLYDRSLEQTQGFIKDDLMNTVKAIVGWDPARDQPEAFSTMVGDFAPVVLAEEMSTGPSMGELALRWGPTVGQVLGVVVVVMFLRGLFKRSSSSSAAASATSPAAKSEVAEEDLPPEEQQKRMRREIERSIANDPAALAKLLETWLVEQKA